MNTSFLKQTILIFFVFFGGMVPVCYGAVTLSGLSGTMLVPGLDVLGHGGAQGGVHLLTTSWDNEGSIKGAFAFNEDTEVAIMKRFVTGKGKGQYDPVFSAKYKIRKNVALAGIFDTTPNYKNSVMLLSGVPGNRVVLGVGANLSTENNERFAHFGRYRDRLSPVDPLFFLLGASVNLDPETEITMDYAGNDFLLGLRHNFNDRVGLDFGYFTPDRLSQESRFSFGVQFGF